MTSAPSRYSAASRPWFRRADATSTTTAPSPSSVPGEEGGGQVGDLVVGNAGGVHQRVAAGRVGDGEQVGGGEDRLGGPGDDAVQRRAEVVTGDEVGTRGLQDAQLPAQGVELGLGGAGVGVPAGEPGPAFPGQVVDARGEAVGLALVVHDLRGRQAEHRGHGREEALRVAAVEPGVVVALVQPEGDGRRRGPRLDDLHRGRRRELGDGAGELADDLARAAHGAQQDDQAVREARVQGGGTDLEHRVGVVEDLGGRGEEPDAGRRSSTSGTGRRAPPARRARRPGGPPRRRRRRRPGRARSAAGRRWSRRRSRGPRRGRRSSDSAPTSGHATASERPAIRRTARLRPASLRVPRWGDRQVRGRT